MLRCCSLALLLSLFIACKTRTPQGDDGKITLTLVQINDVYEIAPLEGGNSGGMARVATIRQQQLARNPNTLLVMAGDFLSPSVYGTLSFEGQRIRGRQMIDAMNVAGVDLAGFGNHEFDISEAELQQRINESRVQWIAANAFHRKGDMVSPFRHTVSGTPIPAYIIRTITDADGTVAKIGFISVVLPSNPAEYVRYTDPVNTAIATYRRIKDSCDAVIAITHMALQDDLRLADSLPQLAAILGGHEHDMKYAERNGVVITKAHANAKSAYVVDVQLNQRRQRTKTKATLVYLNEKIPLDSTTHAAVQRWVKIANDSYAASGFDATAVVPYNGAPLEGREGFTRSGSTNLTELIASAMLHAAPQAQASIFNTGSIRVDDVLFPPITQYDILRTLPFGGGLRELEVTGELLLQVLDAGFANKGSGGWLQYGNIRRGDYVPYWFIQQQPIDRAKTYRIVVPDFLITGKETNLGFFNEKNPGVVRMLPPQTQAGHPQSDVRLAIIQYLQQRR